MRKKICSRLLFMCMMMLFTGCENKMKDEEVESNDSLQVKKITFDEAISYSDCAVNASFVKLHNKDTYVEYEFKVDEVLYGDVPDSTIYIFSMIGEASNGDYTYSLGNEKYIENQSYTLILNKNETIFYDYTRYSLVTDIFIPVSNFTDSKMYNTSLSESINVDDNIGLCDYIKNKKANDKNTDTKKQKKSYSNDLKDIVTNSDLILEVQIESLFLESNYENRNTYICTPINNIKGNDYRTRNDGTIWINLLKNSVEIGETYIIILDKIDDESRIYIQATKNSIFPSIDSKTIDEIMSYLNE